MSTRQECFFPPDLLNTFFFAYYLTSHKTIKRTCTFPICSTQMQFLFFRWPIHAEVWMSHATQYRMGLGLDERLSRKTHVPLQSAPLGGPQSSRGSSMQIWPSSALGQGKFPMPPQNGPLSLTQRPGQSALVEQPGLSGLSMHVSSLGHSGRPRLPQI